MKVQEEDTGNFHVVGKGCVALGTESFFLFNSDCKQPNNMQHRVSIYLLYVFEK